MAAYDIDASRVTVIGSDGEYLRSIGRPGQGPGDLSGHVSLSLKGDTLIAVQGEQDRVSEFLLSSGAFLGSQRIETEGRLGVRASRKVGDTRYYLTRPIGAGDLVARLYRIRDGEARPDTFLTVRSLYLTFRSKRQRNIEMLVPMAQTGPAGVVRFLGDSSVVIVDGLGGTLTVARLAESDLDTISQIELPEKGGPTTEDDERQLRDYVEQWHETMHWDELYVPAVTSAWVAMVLDGDSAVWVKRYGLLDDVPETWIRMRFDQPGVFQRFTFPAGVAVMNVHANQVVAVRKGEYDEDYLQLYQVEPWGR